MSVLTIHHGLRQSLFGVNYSFYRPDSQHGKGQYIEDRNLAQVEDAVKVDIKIERDGNNDNQQSGYYYLVTVWDSPGFCWRNCLRIFVEHVYASTRMIQNCIILGRFR